MRASTAAALGLWACVCGDWHAEEAQVLTDRYGRVVHAPVPEVEEALLLPQ